MRIGINALGPLATDTGGKTYLAGLLQGLSLLKAPREFVVFLNSESRSVFPTLPENFRLIEIHAGAFSYSRVGLEQFLLPFWTRRMALDVFYSPTNALCLGTRIPQVLGLQNVLSFFENSDEGWIRGHYRRWILPRSVRKAVRIIVPSRYTKDLLRERLGVTNERIDAVAHGIDHSLFHPSGNGSASRFKLLQPYLLWVSALWNYKNWEIALEAFARAQPKLPVGMCFVIVGKASDSQTSKAFSNRLRRLGIERNAVCIDALNSEDLAEAYRQAEMLIYPSKIESFGFPVLEAMASGIPVIASSCPALCEITGGAALHIDPLNAEALAHGIYRLWKDREFRSDLVRRAAERARSFSWQETARHTLDVIEKSIPDTAPVS
jgi:glycosyltransferase involved in cell wall biosynthesis